MRRLQALFYGGTIAVSLTVALLPLSYASRPINTIQDGQIISGGNYYNTANGKTTFVNSGSGGLWLKSGNTVRGLEVNSAGSLTRNGGNIHLYAPGQVVRVDGNINVNATSSGQGLYLGNGGKVTVDSAYLFQNGNIFAAGANGGHVHINVNAATFGPNAKIDASAGPNGYGGVIRIKAAGVVDIKPGAEINATGIPGVDANIIQIVGGVVNNEGIIKANGISIANTQSTSGSKGGSIQLVAKDSIDLYPVSKALYHSNIWTSTESKALLSGLRELAKQYNNSVRNTGNILANGGVPSGSGTEGASGSGGNISLIARQNVLNQSGGSIMANGASGNKGGKGGFIELSSKPCSISSQNTDLIQAKGGDSFEPTMAGGQGGQIIVRQLNNSGTINADGGSGDIGGAGGLVKAFNIINGGEIHASGGDGSSLFGGQGGTGGTINAVNIQTHGGLRVNGGNGFGPSASTGGKGGSMTFNQLTNQGYISANGGQASCGTAVCGVGGNGGSITGTKVTNSWSIEAIGGSAVGHGGNGGSIKFTDFTNNNLLTTHGGNGHLGSELEANTVSGNGGLIVLNNAVNRGLIWVNGGFQDDIGGNGGTIKATGITLFGALQADGGSGGTRAGNGGVICLRDFINQNSLIVADGGISTDIQGQGGTIHASNGTNKGVISADGGSHFYNSSQLKAARGGTIRLTNVINEEGAQIRADGGVGTPENSEGGDGGTITGVDVKNYGYIQALGGGGESAGGGNGGTMTFTRITNTGTLEANGGNGRTAAPVSPGGNGGTITGNESTNTGIIRVSGGTGVPNGEAGLINGF